MRLDLSTWREVESYLAQSPGVLLPVGSTEQHGPIGLIGTDALCSELIAAGAAESAKALVAPTLAYTPAPFNTAFPGTISVSERVFEAFVGEIIRGLVNQGFKLIYIVNGHGANIAPLERASRNVSSSNIAVRSWWEFPSVNNLRKELYGDWEGMHATPSEVAITQARHRIVRSEDAQMPPQRLSADYIRDHSGDRHGPPYDHRRDFPDGRVGSHSALARPEHGEALLELAIAAVAEDYRSEMNRHSTST